MAAKASILASLTFLILHLLLFIPHFTFAQVGCFRQCTTNTTGFGGCLNPLVCVNGECNNANPQAPICPVLSPSPPPATPPSSPPAVSPSTTPSQTCLPSGAAVCKFISYPLYNCSPPTTSPTTQATLTFNLLDGPGSLFAPSCDGMRHTQFEVVVAISTGFFNSGNLCGKHIQIKVASGREVVAKVVSQCDSASGCRGALRLNPPCGNNVIEGTRAVFRALGLPLRGSQTVQWTTV